MISSMSVDHPLYPASEEIVLFRPSTDAHEHTKQLTRNSVIHRFRGPYELLEISFVPIEHMASEAFKIDLVIVQDESCSPESALKRAALFNKLKADFAIRAKPSHSERLVFYLISARPRFLELGLGQIGDRESIATVQTGLRNHHSLQSTDRYSDHGPTRFTSAQRSQLVWSVLQKASFDTEESSSAVGSSERLGKHRGIGPLLDDGTFLAAYPLHESTTTSELRKKLSNDWGNFSWTTPQPIGDIKEYFGDQMALYFAWLGFYTYMLFPLSILGTVVFFFNLFLCSSDPRVRDVCGDRRKTVLCPPCDNHCQYTSLDEWCQHAILSSLSDNWLTAPFTLFVILWALVFQVAWRRYVNRVSSHFHFADTEARPRQPRHTFWMATSTPSQAWLDLATSFEMIKRGNFTTFAKRVMIYGSVFAMGFAVLYVSVKILNFGYPLRAVVRAKIGDETLSPIMGLIATSLISVCVIWVLNNVIFYYVAKWLTKLENPETQTEFDHLLTMKLYIAQFVSYYFSVIYVALFQGRFIGRPNSYQDTYPKTPPDQCGPLGCFPELFMQMTCVMFLKPIFNNILEYFLPTFIRCMKILSSRRQYKREGHRIRSGSRPRWERAFVLQEQFTPGLFYEYVEMIMQYGYVVMFAGAYPLAPLFALLNNLFEIRLDGYKFLNKFRRPIAERAEDIGAWYLIMGYLNRIAILINGLLLAFGSDLAPRIYYSLVYRRGLAGYVDFSLAHFDTTTYAANATHYRLNLRQRFCRFPQFRDSPFSIGSGVSFSPDTESELYWILFFRVTLLFAFENVAALMDWVVELFSPKLANPSSSGSEPRDHRERSAWRETEVTSL